MGLDRLQKGWSYCLISSLRTAAPAWPQLLTSLSSGTVCASQRVCGKVTISPYDLWPSHVFLCVLILHLDCNCAHVCAHVCVATMTKHVEALLWYVKSVCVYTYYMHFGSGPWLVLWCSVCRLWCWVRREDQSTGLVSKVTHTLVNDDSQQTLSPLNLYVDLRQLAGQLLRSTYSQEPKHSAEGKKKQLLVAAKHSGSFGTHRASETDTDTTCVSVCVCMCVPFLASTNLLCKSHLSLCCVCPHCIDAKGLRDWSIKIALLWKISVHGVKTHNVRCFLLNEIVTMRPKSCDCTQVSRESQSDVRNVQLSGIFGGTISWRHWHFWAILRNHQVWEKKQIDYGL